MFQGCCECLSAFKKGVLAVAGCQVRRVHLSSVVTGPGSPQNPEGHLVFAFLMLRSELKPTET